MPLALTACTVDLDRLEVHRDGAVSRLSPTERDLLLYLSARPGEVVSRRELLTEVWGYAATVKSRTPDTTLGRLRNKIEADPSQPDHILTVRGGGWEWRLPERPSTGLPPVVDTFVGREAELAALAERAVPGTVLLVTGPAGSGRSRLVHEHIRRQPGRVLWVDVTDAEDPGLDLGAALSGGGTPVDAATAARRCTVDHLVIDGLTATSESLQVLLLALVANAASTSVLATAPRALGLPGEHVFALPPLNPADAAALWAARCRTEVQADALLELLDGHPLAIELAAGRVGVLGPDRLAERVQRRLDVLQDRRDGSSVQAPLAEAWEALEPWARTTLVRLSPVRAGFDLDAAEALIGDLDGPWGLDALDDLVRWSWVNAGTGPDGHPRFHVPRLVALFAEQNASADALAAARVAHAQHYAARVVAAYDPDLRRLGYRTITAMTAEVANLLAALPHAPDQATRFELLLGLGGLRQRAPVPDLEPLLIETARTEPNAERAYELHLLRVEQHWLTGGLPRVLELLRDVEPPSPGAAAVAQAFQATALNRMREPGTEALARSVVASPHAPLGAKLRAWIELDGLGDPDALALADEAMREVYAPPLKASLASQRAIRAIFEGRLEDARTSAHRAVQLSREARHPYAIAFARALVAELELALDGQTTELRPSIDAYERLGHQGFAAHYEATAARAALLDGDIQGGRRIAERAVSRVLRHDTASELVRCREAAAEAAWMDGDPSAARVHLRAALDASDHPGLHAFLALVEGRPPPDSEPPTEPEGVHGTMRWRVLCALARGEAPPEPEFPELVSVRVVRLLDSDAV